MFESLGVIIAGVIIYILAYTTGTVIYGKLTKNKEEQS